MVEPTVNSVEEMNAGEGTEKTLPAKVSFWTKVKQFLCQEITIELTPKQEKVFQEVHDFWHQDITGQDVKNLLLHEITWQSTKDFWLQKIDITLYENRGENKLFSFFSFKTIEKIK